MHSRIVAVAGLFALALAGAGLAQDMTPAAAPAAEPAPTSLSLKLPAPRTEKEAVQRFIEMHSPLSSYEASKPLADWDAGLFADLKRGYSLDRAAADLAPRYGLSEPAMRSLVGLWIASASDINLDDDGPRHSAATLDRMKAIVASSGHAELVLRAAVHFFAPFGKCQAQDLADLSRGATDETATQWSLTTWSDCPGWFEGFAKAHPDRATGALMRMVNYGELTNEEELALYGWLVSDAGLSHVDPADRSRVAVYLDQDYLTFLLNHGLVDQALATLDRMSAAERASLTAPQTGVQVKVDSLAVELQTPQNRSDTDLDLAAAFYAKGRVQDALALAPENAELAAARRRMACKYDSAPDPRKGRDCGSYEDQNRDARVLELDAALRHAQDDPYPIEETFYAGMGGDAPEAGVWSDMLCRLFADPTRGDLCANSRRATVDSIRESPYSVDEGETAAHRLIAAAAIPAFDELKRTARAELDAAATLYGGEGFPDRGARAHVDPAPPPFAVQPIPEPYRGAAPDPDLRWTKSLAPLPPGYEPVRIARDGKRVVVISVSQNYDPTGEVSRGGYWAHLSDDGGRTWRRPLYTGLAEMFPYVVLSNSKLPLIDGDALNLAVEVRELDTATITYPPVALQTKRSAGDLYLHIPIADLTRDSESSGLTDLAAEHLLLRPKPTGRTPYVMGTSAVVCDVDRGAQLAATAALLKRLFSVNTGAIIEPADRSPNGPLTIGLGGVDPNSADRPIFVEGDPADFACLKPDRLMIVYSAADMQRLRTHTPDFHAVSLTKFVYNRARDRGYVSWSTGWSGGTARLIKRDGTWSLEEIGSWIS